MSKNKLFVLMAAIVAIVISVGFYGLGDNRENVATFNNGSYTGPVTIHEGGVQDLVGAWSTGANITAPGTYFGHATPWSSGASHYLYVFGGNAPSAGNYSHRYNVVTNVWEARAVVPYNIVVNGTATLRDSVYTFGGYLNGSTPTTNFYRHSVPGNSWTARAPMPAAAAFCKGVGYQDSLIYVCQGYTGSAVTGVVWLYNSNSNSWRTCTSMPGSRFGGAFNRSGDTLVYVGGADLSLFYNTTFRGVISQADRSVITWTTGLVNPQIGAGMYRMDASNWGCKGIIHTGGSNSASFASVSNINSVYSPGANTWTAQPNRPVAWTCGQVGSFNMGSGIWKFVTTSGYSGAAVLLDTRIFTDTLCAAPSGGIVQTVCRNGINVAVPDNSTVGARDSITITYNAGCLITDVNVKIDTFPHTWISDMQFSLRHNNATPVNLFLNRGGSGDNIIGCTFNDSAAQPISAGTPPFTGSWRPEQPLSAYNGQFMSGVWTLWMVDQFAGDLGFLKAWCITFTVICPTGGVTTIEIPNTYRLSQNYPNPFNPTTTIKYGLPKFGQTKLVVYDILGRVVTTLVDEVKDAGTYTVNFDATNLSTGVYFYTLESGDYKATKKMLLVK